METGELPLVERDPARHRRRRGFRPIRFTIKSFAFVAAIYFLLLPLLPEFRRAIGDLSRVQPLLLGLGLALQITALFTYSLLTRSALGTAGAGLSRMRFFRIQMSTKALSNIVPGGSAASSALGYRLLTLSGVSGPDAGFALATAGLGSAVVLNLIFWAALIISIPIRGVNAGYVTAALAGVIIMILVGGIVLGLMHGQGRADRIVRWVAGRFRSNGDRAVSALRQIGTRLEELLEDPALLKRVVFWASANWLLDAASLWVFIRAFDRSVEFDALLIAFGLANVLAAIPITPGGLGVVDASLVASLIGFGLPRRIATIGVASYRLAQYWFPIVLGGVLYLSLRIGPWQIERRERLVRLRDLAEQGTAAGSESRIDFALRSWERSHPRSVRSGDPPSTLGSAPDGDSDQGPPSPGH